MTKMADLGGPWLRKLLTLWILLFMDILDKEGMVAIFLVKGSICLIKLLLYLRIAKSILITHKLLPILLVPMICLS